MRLIWCGISLHPLAFVAAIFFLAETGSNGGVMRWEGLPGADLKPLEDIFTHIIWGFSTLVLCLGFYCNYLFRRHRLESDFATFSDHARQTVRHQVFVLQIMNTAGLAATVYVLLGGSIWHFLGINLICLICMFALFPTDQKLLDHK